MSQLRLIGPTQESGFLDRYALLLNWAMQFTRGDVAAAEDLVHDAFVHFSLQKPDLDAIADLNAYLYRVLRNLHISQSRRAGSKEHRLLPLEEYDSLRVALNAIGPEEREQAEEELRAICDHACGRKNSSKGASVLLLRFFHGYYPLEIAKLTLLQTAAVDKSLSIARKEARAFLKEQRTPTSAGEPSSDITSELRERIFAARDTPCLPAKQWREQYTSPSGESLATPLLAHLVSCRDCLGFVTRLLRLRSLDKREPPDMLGPGNRSAGLTDIKRGATPRRSFKRSSSSVEFASDITEHEPRQLRVLSNGFALCSQTVAAPLTEFQVSAGGEERTGFIEVFSEQDVRLLLLNVTPPPDRDVEQGAFLRLSRGRTLDVVFSFRSTVPTLFLRYVAPEFEYESENAVPEPGPVPVLRGWRRVFDVFRGPVLTGAIIAIALVIVIAIASWRAGSVSAAAILQKAVAQENQLASAHRKISHQVMRLEARRRAKGGTALFAEGRVDTWKDPSRHLRITKLLDSARRPVATYISRPNGTETRSEFGVDRTNPLLTFAPEVWQSDLTAREFANQVFKTTGNRLSAREETDGYRLTVATVAGSSELEVDKRDLHARERITTEDRDGETYVYTLTEIASENIEELPAVAETSVKSLVADNDVSPGPSPQKTRAVELEVLRALDQKNALSGEDVSVTRSGSGTVYVRAIVEDESRKLDILEALHEIRIKLPNGQSPLLSYRISTVADAVREEAQRPVRVIRKQIEVTSGTVTAFSALRDLFGRGNLSEAQASDQANQFAEDMLRASSRVRLAAHALRELGEHSGNEPEFVDLLRPHVADASRQMAAMRKRIDTLFPSGEDAETEAPASNDLRAKISAAYRATVAQDEAFRSAFSVPSASEAAFFEPAEIWRRVNSTSRAFDVLMQATTPTGKP